MLKKAVAKRERWGPPPDQLLSVWGVDLTPAHLSTMANTTPARTPADSAHLHPTNCSVSILKILDKVLLSPTDLQNLSPTE